MEHPSLKVQTHERECPTPGPANDQIWRNVGPSVKIRRRTAYIVNLTNAALWLVRNNSRNSPLADPWRCAASQIRFVANYTMTHMVVVRSRVSNNANDTIAKRSGRLIYALVCLGHYLRFTHISQCNSLNSNRLQKPLVALLVVLYSSSSNVLKNMKF